MTAGPADRPAGRPAGRPADWDAGAYARVSTPQRDWSAAVLDRLRLSGDETVIDAGCGSGEVTAALLDRLPDGRVIAVDGSPSMIARAGERLADAVAAGRVELLRRDLVELDLDRAADRVFSNAVFHWVPDQPRLFRRLAAALRPGGRLVAEYGGRGNVAAQEEAIAAVAAEPRYREWLAGYRSPWTFAGPEETAEWLLAAGFEQPECWLEERTARPEDPRGFFEASFLAPIRERLPADLFPRFLEETLAAMGHPSGFEYIRLNIDARRA